MTSQFQEALSRSNVKAIARGANPSAALKSEDLNPETEASAAVRSSLYRYT